MYVQNTCMSLIQQISMEYNGEESYCGHIWLLNTNKNAWVGGGGLI